MTKASFCMLVSGMCYDVSGSENARALFTQAPPFLAKILRLKYYSSLEMRLLNLHTGTAVCLTSEKFGEADLVEGKRFTSSEMESLPMEPFLTGHDSSSVISW